MHLLFVFHFSRILPCVLISFWSLETKHQLHAKEVTQTLDLSKYDGLVCVSGDGILVEVSWLCFIAILMTVFIAGVITLRNTIRYSERKIKEKMSSFFCE